MKTITKNIKMHGVVDSVSDVILSYDFSSSDQCDRKNNLIIFPEQSQCSFDIYCNELLQNLDHEKDIFKIAPFVLISGKLSIQHDGKEKEILIINNTLFSQSNVLLDEFSISGVEKELDNEYIDSIKELFYNEGIEYDCNLELNISYCDTNNETPDKLIKKIIIFNTDILEIHSATSSRNVFINKSENDKNLISKYINEYRIISSNGDFEVGIFGIWSMDYICKVEDNRVLCTECAFVGSLVNDSIMEEYSDRMAIIKIWNHCHEDEVMSFVCAYSISDGGINVAKAVEPYMNKIKNMIMLAIGNPEAYLEIELYTIKEG